MHDTAILGSFLGHGFGGKTVTFHILFKSDPPPERGQKGVILRCRNVHFLPSDLSYGLSIEKSYDLASDSFFSSKIKVNWTFGGKSATFQVNSIEFRSDRGFQRSAKMCRFPYEKSLVTESDFGQTTLGGRLEGSPLWRGYPRTPGFGQKYPQFSWSKLATFPKVASGSWGRDDHR